MAQKGYQRKITAILSADVVGYSRFMREDETATARNIAAHRVLIYEIIQQHDGRVIDPPGDKILAKFASVVDAVNGAIKIQEGIKKSNTDTPENCRMGFRIAINLGDGIEDEKWIYGYGVNIAEQVEGLAAAGGIFISGTVYEHIKDKLSLGYHFLGEQDVKNIPEPVQIYRLVSVPNEAGKVIAKEKSKSKKFRYAAIGAFTVIILVVGAVVAWNNVIRFQIEPALKKKMAFSVPDKPSIAVLPFDNLSGDPDHNHICDGISESIISALSMLPELLVIARNSTFYYKGKAVKLKRIAEELGVRFVMAGSVKGTGFKFRVIARLIDAVTGQPLWSEQYDTNMLKLFQLCDEITLKIVAALHITPVDRQTPALIETNNRVAWSYTIKGINQYHDYTKDQNKRARYQFEQAVKVDPEYAYAWMMLAFTYLADARFGFSESFSDSLEHCIQYAKKASGINNRMPELHTLWSLLYSYQRKYDQAIAKGRMSIELNPNNADGYLFYATTLIFVKRIDEAVALAQHSLRLSPNYPSWYLWWVAFIYREAGHYQEALHYANSYLSNIKNGHQYFQILGAHLQLAIIYAIVKDYEKAKFHWAEIKKNNPKYNLELWRKMSTRFAPFEDPARLERIAAALIEAGLK